MKVRHETLPFISITQQWLYCFIIQPLSTSRYTKRADSGFSLGGGGGTTDYARARTFMTLRARNPKSLTARVQDPLEGPGSSRRGGGVDALSCYLSLIFKHSNTKWDFKKQPIKKKKLGGVRLLCPPPPPPSKSATAIPCKISYLTLTQIQL